MIKKETNKIWWSTTYPTKNNGLPDSQHSLYVVDDLKLAILVFTNDLALFCFLASPVDEAA